MEMLLRYQTATGSFRHLSAQPGMPKAEVMAQRLHDINPELGLTVNNEFISDDRIRELLESQPFDYVIDAIDTLSPKVSLMYECHQLGLKIVSSMGAGGKLIRQK